MKCYVLSKLGHTLCLVAHPSLGPTSLATTYPTRDPKGGPMMGLAHSSLVRIHEQWGGGVVLGYLQAHKLHKTLEALSLPLVSLGTRRQHFSTLVDPCVRIILSTRFNSVSVHDTCLIYIVINPCLTKRLGLLV
ncbi:hypothetical protein HanRHA438_Chr17g0827641 [Helianthus annuus]|nr:hypothetical protein HanRHA438_Chr17g0827641 [Helianthus annuus]